MTASPIHRNTAQMQYTGGREVHIQTVPHVTHEGSKFPTAPSQNPSVHHHHHHPVRELFFRPHHRQPEYGKAVGFEFHYANAGWMSREFVVVR